MNSLKILSLGCAGLLIAAFGVMWSTGVFSGLSAGVVAASLFGIFLAALIGTALTVLAVYSDTSGHDDIVFHFDDNPDNRGRPQK
jgi:hypothetical protein